MESPRKYLTVDQILPIVGEFGKFQIVLDAMVFMMFLPVAFHPIIAYFSALTPEWSCTQIANATMCYFNGTFTADDNIHDRCSMPLNEWKYLEVKDFSLVTQFELHCKKKWLLNVVASVFFVGWGIGAIINGWLADRFGRKKFLFPSIIMVLTTCVVTPYVPNIYLVILCRFIIGFFYPGVCVQSFVLLSELVGNKQRPLATLIPYLSYPVGWMIVALKAYLLRNWKHMSLACSVPYVFVLGFYPLIPESVRWLQLHGRPNEAMETFRRIARWNKREMPTNIVLAAPRINLTSDGSFLDLIRSCKVALRNCIQTYIWTFIALNFYGLQLAASDLEGSVYRDFVLLSIVEIPAIFIAIASCKKFGRKKTSLVPLLFSGTACLVIAFIPEKGYLKIARIVLGMMGKMFTSVTFNSLYVWSTELFPTGVRGAGMGVLQVSSRIGSSSSPWVANGLKVFYSWLPFAVMGVTSLLGAILGFFLPETMDTVLRETNIDNENAVGALEEKKGREMDTLSA